MTKMKVTTGLKGMDSVLNGGFPSNTVILVSGGPGTGKTLVALNFLLEGAAKGEKCCYVSLNEDEGELLRACKGIKSLCDVEKYKGKNLAIESIHLGESLTLKKFVDIIESYPHIDRLIIDNVNKLLMFGDTKTSYRIHLTELVKHIKKMNCTLLLCETENDNIDTGNGEAFETDGVINLSFSELEEKPMRTLTVHKLRYTSFEPKISHELIINSSGLKLGSAKII